jgi:hypothetical protein
MSDEDRSKELYDLCLKLLEEEVSFNDIQRWLDNNKDNEDLLKKAANYKDEDNDTPLHYLLMRKPPSDLVKRFSQATKLIVGSTVAHSTIFEDNKGCVKLANAPRMRPRTRHIGLKYHHFHSHVENGKSPSPG